MRMYADAEEKRSRRKSNEKSEKSRSVKSRITEDGFRGRNVDRMTLSPRSRLSNDNRSRKFVNNNNNVSDLRTKIKGRRRL